MRFDPAQVEIIVVDDGGKFNLDNVLAEFPGPIPTRLLRQKNAGPGAARNHGVASARGEHIVFIDDDCLADPELLADYARGFSQSPKALLGGRVLTSRQQNLYCQSSQMVIDMVHAFFNKDANKARFFSSNNFAVPKAEFVEIGGFMGKTFRLASEDREFCDRWKHEGRELRALSGASIFHEPNLDLYSYTRMYFRYGRGAFRYQQLRKQRGSGSIQEDTGFHVELPRLLSRFLSRYSFWNRLGIAMLLGVWQLANFGGFFYELMQQKLQSAQPPTDDAAEMMHQQVEHGAKGEAQSGRS